MATEVTLSSPSGERTDYTISFEGGLVETRQLEFGERDFIGGPQTGSVVDGVDIWVGVGDFTVKNQNKRIFGQAPDLLVEFDGMSEIISSTEEVTFRVSEDGTDNGAPAQGDMEEVIISGIGSATSDYKIESEGEVEGRRDIEFFGDEIQNKDPGIIAGAINPDGVDVWGVEVPFTIRNLSKSVEGIENRSILAQFSGRTVEIAQGDFITFDGQDVSVGTQGGFNLFNWVSNNPGKALIIGAGSFVVINTATETAVSETI